MWASTKIIAFGFTLVFLSAADITGVGMVDNIAAVPLSKIVWESIGRNTFDLFTSWSI